MFRQDVTNNRIADIRERIIGRMIGEVAQMERGSGGGTPEAMRRPLGEFYLLATYVYGL